MINPRSLRVALRSIGIDAAEKNRSNALPAGVYLYSRTVQFSSSDSKLPRTANLGKPNSTEGFRSRSSAQGLSLSQRH